MRALIRTSLSVARRAAPYGVWRTSVAAATIGGRGIACSRTLHQIHHEDVEFIPRSAPAPKSRGYFKYGLLAGLVLGLTWGAIENRMIRLDDEATVQPPTKCDPFPTKVDIAGEQFDNIGVGVRTVSFLRIHVYAVGIYVAHSDINKAHGVLNRIIDLHGKLFSDDQSVQVIDSLLEAGVRFAVRITPVRNTDFGHLRDGFVRSIMNNPLFKEVGNNELFGEGLNELRRVFGRKLKAAKGDSIYMTQDRSGGMTSYYASKSSPDTLETLGTVSVPEVARVFYLQYLSGKNPNSTSARDSARDGLLALA